MNSWNFILPVKKKIKDTAGLKWAPEICVNININTISPKIVANEFANKIMASISVRFTAIIPDPTMIIKRNIVPMNSEMSFGFIR